MPKFVLAGSTGLLVRGNIDIDARTMVKVPVGGGKFASVRSVIWSLEQPDLRQRTGLVRAIAYIVVPTVVRGSGKWLIVNDKGALSHYYKTGRHLGIFDTLRNAQSYCDRLHLQQAAASR